MNDLTRPEVDAKLAAGEAKLDARLANFDTTFKTGFAELRADMARMQAENRERFAELRADMARMQADMIKWVVGIGFAVVGATVGLLNYMHKVPVPGQSQPVSPIVIYAIPAPPPVPK